MFKKIIVIMMVIAIAFSLSISAFAEGGVALGDKNETERLIDRQTPLISAYNKILEGMKETNQADLPFQLGGMYIDFDYLHINVVGNIEAAKDYCAFWSGDTSILMYHKVRYSYEDLKSLVKAFSENPPDYVVSISIDEINNQVLVGVDENLISKMLLITEDDRDNCLSNIKELLVSSALTSSEWINEKSIPMKCIFRAAANTSATSLKGGMKLTNTLGNFSLGVCGTYINSLGQSLPVILTCGHGQTLGGTITESISGNGIGPVIVKQFGSGLSYDYSIVRVTNTTGFTLTNYVNGSVSMTSKATSHPVGTVITKYGVNGYATGTIANTGVTVYYYNEGFSISGLVEVNITSSYIGNCGGGDSGCSIYRNNTFYGLYSGDNRSDTVDATIFWYSPIGAVPNFTLW